ncbi:MAG TPA: hypothetical protein PLR99_32985, partial [Polyangiaceae bacterium]|nr:hypothetical protein [Polyangiaceae bacterium]
MSEQHAEARGATGSPRKEPDLDAAPMTPGNAARVAAAGLFFHACGLLAAALLASYGLAAMIAQAVIAEWGVSRLGVRWTAEGAAPSTPSPMARGARGVALGAGAAALTTAALLATGAGHFERGGLVPTTLAVGALSAGATAVWHELYYRGLVLRVTEKIKQPYFRLLAAGLAEAAAAAAMPGATTLEVVVAGLFGALMAALWLQDRGAVLACAAHAGWLFTTRSVLRGGVFELAGTPTLLGGNGAGPFAGLAAAGVLAASLVALLVARARQPS